MARKRTKGAQAHNTDSGDTTQTHRPELSQSRAQQQPKPKSKPGSKPAATNSSVKKTRQHHKAKAKTPDTLTLQLPEHLSKTTSKPNKTVTNPRGQAGFSKKKSEPDMARSRNKRPNAALSAQTAKLELPEGYTPPNQQGQKKQQAQKKKQHNRSRKTNQVCIITSTEYTCICPTNSLISAELRQESRGQGVRSCPALESG